MPRPTSHLTLIAVSSAFTCQRKWESERVTSAIINGPRHLFNRHPQHKIFWQQLPTHQHRIFNTTSPAQIEFTFQPPYDFFILPGEQMIWATITQATTLD
jgi:hypothetical protein